MGTGKTSVGHALAKRLNRKLVDMDTWIQAREGQTIAEIFAERGEADFREMEGALARELAASENMVIATGGGALVSDENRAVFAKARVICLDASADEILRRLEQVEDRPLLQGDRRARVAELLEARRDAYESIPLHVQTDGRTPEEIAGEIVSRLETRELEVQTPTGAYPIFLGTGLLERAGELLRGRGLAARCAVVTNATVGARYADRVCDSLRAHKFSPVRIDIADGEQAKNLDTVRALYDALVAAKLERRSPVLALGGGVIGDTVGFAAATYLRGVPLVQIPTTLLAMVDSSIGGKVAVDLPSGKNLVGAFKFPVCVIADPDVLESLPAEELRAGMAEVIKHGILGDAELFRALKSSPGMTPALVERALAVKIRVVEQDPFEENTRAHLNLGHTFGQAMETLAGYRMRHGDAVAMGIAVAARLAAMRGLCDMGTRDEILALLTQYELPTRIPSEFSAEQVVSAMGTDKKIRDGKLRLILPRAIGRVEIVSDVPREQVLSALEESRSVPGGDP
jgi:3-dehydroquinate synthase